MIKRIVCFFMIAFIGIQAAEPGPSKRRKLEEDITQEFSLPAFALFEFLPVEIQERIINQNMDEIIKNSKNVEQAIAEIKKLRTISQLWKNIILTSDYFIKKIIIALSNHFNISAQLTAFYFLGPQALQWILNQQATKKDVHMEVLVAQLLQEALSLFSGSPESKYIIKYLFTAANHSIKSTRQYDGKIVYIQPEQGLFVLKRIESSGLIDETFHTMTLSGDIISIKKIISKPDGTIVLVGTTANSSKIIQLLPDGQIDSSFGTQGIVTIPGATLLSVAVLPSGSLITVGEKEDKTCILLLSANGEYYAQFVRFGNKYLSDVIITPDQEIIAVGGARKPSRINDEPFLAQITIDEDFLSLTNYKTISYLPVFFIPQLLFVQSNNNRIVAGVINQIINDKSSHLFIIILYDNKAKELDRFTIPFYN